MFDGEFEVEDVFGGDDAGVAGKSGEVEGGDVGAAVAAVDAVRHEGGVGHTQDAGNGAEPDAAFGGVAHGNGIVQAGAHDGRVHGQDGVVGHLDQMQRRRGAAVLVHDGHPIDTCGVHLDLGCGVAGVPKIMRCGREGVKGVFRAHADGRCADNLHFSHCDGHKYAVMPGCVSDGVQEDSGLCIVFAVEYKGSVAADESGDVERGGWGWKRNRNRGGTGVYGVGVHGNRLPEEDKKQEDRQQKRSALLSAPGANFSHHLAVCRTQLSHRQLQYTQYITSIFSRIDAGCAYTTLTVWHTTPYTIFSYCKNKNYRSGISLSEEKYLTVQCELKYWFTMGKSESELPVDGCSAHLRQKCVRLRKMAASEKAPVG